MAAGWSNHSGQNITNLVKRLRKGMKIRERVKHVVANSFACLTEQINLLLREQLKEFRDTDEHTPSFAATEADVDFEEPDQDFQT